MQGCGRIICSYFLRVYQNPLMKTNETNELIELMKILIEELEIIHVPKAGIVNVRKVVLDSQQ